MPLRCSLAHSPPPPPPPLCPLPQVRPETPALDAMVLMEEKSISAVAVVNAQGAIIGNFSISELRWVDGGGQKEEGMRPLRDADCCRPCPTSPVPLAYHPSLLPPAAPSWLSTLAAWPCRWESSWRWSMARVGWWGQAGGGVELADGASHRQRK